MIRFAVIGLAAVIAVLLALEIWITVGAMQPGLGLGILYVFPVLGLQIVCTLALAILEGIGWRMLPRGPRLFGAIMLVASILVPGLLYGLVAATE